MSHTLLICGHYPLPENIGVNIRTMNFVRFFKQMGPVDIAYSNVLPGAPTGNPIFSAEFRLRLRANKSYKTELLHRMFTGIPFPIYEWDAPSRRSLSARIRAGVYDHILVRYVYSTALLLTLGPEPVRRTILDFDDLLSSSAFNPTPPTGLTGVRGTIARWNGKRLKQYERDCLRFGAVLFCSEHDRTEMAGEGSASAAFVVPNVYSSLAFEAYDWAGGYESANTLLYVGTLDYEPNRESLTWFIETIFPTFRRTYTDAKLLVVGRYPDSKMRQLCESRRDIELHADVADLKPFYARARAVVVPVLRGGGTRIKILEAALALRPILSTPFGASGLALEPDRDILLFGSAAEFKDQYARLADRDTYEALTRRARDVVATRYSARAFNAAMEKVVEGR